MSCRGPSHGQGQPPYPAPVQRGCDPRHAGTVPWHAHAQGAGGDAAVHGSGEHQGLPVDTDRDGGSVGLDDDLAGGDGGQPAALPAVQQQSRRFGGAGDFDAEHPQFTGIQSLLRRPSPAESPFWYGLLLTSTAWGPSRTSASARTLSREPLCWASRAGSISKMVRALSSR